MTTTASLDGAVCMFGNPLLDISADAPAELLEKYELKSANAILAEPKHMPLFEEMERTLPVTYVAGGATQNSARVCQWMLQHKGAVSYIGAVGKDKHAADLQAAAEKDGLNVQYWHNDSVPTGTCAVLVCHNDRSLVANVAAAGTYPVSHFFEEAQQAVVNKARVFYIAGFFLTSSPATIMEVAKHAAANNKIFAMNLSAPFLIEFFGKDMDAAFPYMDIVFGNETEAETFGRVKGAGSEIDEIALHMAALPKVNAARPRIVVITQGSRQVVVASEGKATHYPVPPVAREEIVDVNGAGDAFVGGFMSQLAQGKSMDDCVRAGTYAAQVVIRHSGCTFPPKPTFA